MNRNINEQKIYDKITQYIAACYGLNEAENPCYNIKELARVLTKFLKDGEADVSMLDFLQNYIPDYADCMDNEYDLTDDNLKQAVNYVYNDEYLWDTLDDTINNAIRPYIKKGENE